MAGDVVHDLATASGMADTHRVLQVEMRGQRRKVVGMVVHVVAGCALARAAMASGSWAMTRKPRLRKNSICVSQSSDDSGQPWLKTMGCASFGPHPCRRC
jgi:hypothetical protein